MERRRLQLLLLLLPREQHLAHACCSDITLLQHDGTGAEPIVATARNFSLLDGVCAIATNTKSPAADVPPHFSLGLWLKRAWLSIYEWLKSWLLASRNTAAVAPSAESDARVSRRRLRLCACGEPDSHPVWEEQVHALEHAPRLLLHFAADQRQWQISHAWRWDNASASTSSVEGVEGDGENQQMSARVFGELRLGAAIRAKNAPSVADDDDDAGKAAPPCPAGDLAGDSVTVGADGHGSDLWATIGAESGRGMDGTGGALVGIKCANGGGAVAVGSDSVGYNEARRELATTSTCSNTCRYSSDGDCDDVRAIALPIALPSTIPALLPCPPPPLDSSPALLFHLHHPP